MLTSRWEVLEVVQAPTIACASRERRSKRAQWTSDAANNASVNLGPRWRGVIFTSTVEESTTGVGSVLGGQDVRTDGREDPREREIVCVCERERE